MTKLRAVGRGKALMTVIDRETGRQPDDQEIAWAGAMLAALMKVPPERRVYILAIVCDAYVKSPHLQATAAASAPSGRAPAPEVS